MEPIRKKYYHRIISMIIAVTSLWFAFLFYSYRMSELDRLYIIEKKMKPYINYNMEVCGIMNKYMEYLSWIDQTTKTFLMYEKSINELQKQNPKYDILAIDWFLKKAKPAE